MKRLFALALGILTAIGGFVDIGDLVTNALVGSRFGMALAWVVVAIGLAAWRGRAELNVPGLAGALAGFSVWAFFNFARNYVGSHQVDKSFEVTDAVVQDFRKFLDSQKIPHTEAELHDSLDWIKAGIKSEIFVAQFGQEEGLQVRAQTDPQVLSALNLLPKAKDLADNAKRILAQRAAAQQTNR